MTAWDEWIGRERAVADDIVRSPARRAAAMFGDLSTSYREEDDALPPVWHWFHFLEPVARDATGPDGHAAKGGFLPPIALPRRMYAGGRFDFRGPIRYGAPAEKRTTILSVAEKTGKTGPLAFVTVRYDIMQDGEVATSEEHDIVYREAERADAPKPAPPRSNAAIMSQESVAPDEVMLFRFSALTYNGHRIHYDKPYVTGVEGYPGLITHGPLVALLLFERARRLNGGRAPRRFSFRAMSPVFCNDMIRLCEVEGEAGGMAMEARGADDRLIMSSRTEFDAG